MANFKPLKNYLLMLIDDLIEEHKLSHPFLDAGCGVGDVTLHFAQRGWSGQAIDISAKSIEAARNLLGQFDDIKVTMQDIRQARGRYKTIFLLDVIEHEEGDDELIKSVKNKLDQNGALIIATTIRQSEWRWDDDYYGHVRRYEVGELGSLLEKNGFEIIEMLDFTFPVFWLIRRIYTKVVPRKIILGKRNDQTLHSSLQSAWDRGVFSSLVERIIWWQPIFRLQKKFKRKLKGCECLVLARRKK